MKARIDEDSSIGPYLSIYVENIEYNSSGTVKIDVENTDIVGTLSDILNPKHKPFETYMLGTQTHVSSFVMQNSGTYYLFDTTGHTHQTQKKLQPQIQPLQIQQPQIQQLQILQILKSQLQIQPLQIQQLQILQNLKKQKIQQIQLQQKIQIQTQQVQRLQDLKRQIQQLQIPQELQAIKLQDIKLQVLKLQSQEQQNKVQYYTSKLIFKKKTSLPNKPNIQSENHQIAAIKPDATDESDKTIYPIILNPFGLDYQNGSSACGIWTVNVLAAVSKTYTNVEDFIIKDEEEDYIAMFKSEFILKVSAEVAKELKAEKPEVKILEQENDLPPEGYYKCKVGNTLFAINTVYNTGSCLNIENILLSISQKELEFYNDNNNINDKIIKEREQLVEKIKADKTKYETIISIVTAEPDKQLSNFSEFVKSLVKKLKNNDKNNGKISNTSDMIREIKLHCEKQIKIIDSQLNHAQKVDELFLERQNKQINQSQQNNTEQQSDHIIRYF